MRKQAHSPEGFSLEQNFYFARGSQALYALNAHQPSCHCLA